MSMRKKILPLLLLVCVLGCTQDREPPPSAVEREDTEFPTDAIPPQEIDTADERTTFRLASWNIRIFSHNSRDDAELEQICEILSRYDFIAIVELRDEAVLRRTEATLETMGRDYDYEISSPVGRGVKELYAFLYDSAIVEVVEAGRVFSDPEDLFIREPYFASFRAGRFDFTIIAIHVIWGKTVAQRRAEILQLDDVYRTVQDIDPSERDILLVGDFNRNPDDSQSYSDLTAIPSMISLFSLPQKSHIRGTSLYDNVWFAASHVTEYTGESGIYHFDEIHFANDDKAASLAVSDHRPVWAEFRIDLDDD
jgi:endonuclease/exonuclease/phosphatase family metal-dependent hydrolase